jgi:hypothetical protein
MFSISARLDANLSPDDILALFGLDDHGRVQRMIDQSVIDYCRPYIPASPNRILEDSAQVSTDIGSGMVVWNTPYAHYQYAGIVYGPNIPIIDPETGVLMGWFSPPGRPKHPTDRELTYDTSQNPMAGPYWFERMKADRLRDILDAAANAASQGK